MNFFNQTVTDRLSALLKNSAPFKLIILWGERGNGKTFSAHLALQENQINTKEIIFSEENVAPFELPENSLFSINDEDAILIQCSQLFRENYCLYFQNMEFCDLDSQRILHRLIKYHKNNMQKALIILEYNDIKEPNDILCSLTEDRMFYENPDKEFFYTYYAMSFNQSRAAKGLFEKVLQITHRNIHNFFSALKILQYMGILHQDEKGFVYNKKSAYEMPDSLFDLYVDLFDSLKDYIREPLITAAPFSDEIYSEIIRGIYNNYDRFEEHLKLLCEKGCFILKNYANENSNSYFFQSNYKFSDDYARKAIIARMDTEKMEHIISKYYNHLDSLYHNKHIYDNLQETDKILLLSKLTKERQGVLRINQIQYIAELMTYYYERFMYLNAIKQGEHLLESRIVNNLQLNDVSHQFWIIFFKALLAVGDYEKVLGYKGQFENEDLNYYIALALYNYGRPADALDLLENKLCDTVEYKAYVYNLESSIYDWLGNNKKSAMSFRKALLYSDDKLKYQLYKKYNMYIDFRIPECREKMHQATEYYKSRNLKQYAECLHNYGTGYVMINDFVEAQKYLDASIQTLNKICANEIYYPLNSLAILYCYNGNKYKSAIDVLKSALKCDIDIPFCALAIHNNLFNIAINMKNIDSAKTERTILETLFKKECAEIQCVPKERPDLQHQLRQFYYNCALLYKLEKNDENALKFFVKAKECSIYHSVVLYSIEKNIDDIKSKLGKRKFITNIKILKSVAPTELENYIYENNSYLCEIMFWG